MSVFDWTAEARRRSRPSAYESVQGGMLMDVEARLEGFEKCGRQGLSF